MGCPIQDGEEYKRDLLGEEINCRCINCDAKYSMYSCDASTLYLCHCGQTQIPAAVKNDNVNHPAHYTSSKAMCSGCEKPIECIDVTRHMSFNIGNAVKYLWRYKLKNGREDLAKAIWYINDEINNANKS